MNKLIGKYESVYSVVESYDVRCWDAGWRGYGVQGEASLRWDSLVTEFVSVACTDGPIDCHLPAADAPRPLSFIALRL